MKKLIRLLFIYFGLISTCLSDNLKVFEFTELELSKLEVRKVRGADNKTIYEIGSNKNGKFLKAIADNACLLYTSPSPRDRG